MPAPPLGPLPHAPTYCVAPGSGHFWEAGAASSLGTGPVGSGGLLGGLSSRSTSSWKPATMGFPPAASPSLPRRDRAVGGQEEDQAPGPQDPPAATSTSTIMAAPPLGLVFPWGQMGG